MNRNAPVGSTRRLSANYSIPCDLNFLAYAVRRLGQLAWRAGDYERAAAHCQESLRMNREVADWRGTCACLAGFVAIAVGKGDYETAAVLAAAVEAQLACLRHPATVPRQAGVRAHAWLS